LVSLLAITGAVAVTVAALTSRQGSDARPPPRTAAAPQGTSAAVHEPACAPPLRTIEHERTRFCAVLDAAGRPVPSGPFVAYHDEALRVKARSGTYVEGREQGVWREWYPAGSLRSELTFDGGQPHGPWREWYEAGAARSEGAYAQGEEAGTWRFWHPDGGLAEQGAMLDGARDGQWSGWHPSGRDRYHRTYRRGVLLSWQEWDSEGEPVGASD